MAKKSRKLMERLQQRREAEVLKAQAKYEISPTPLKEETVPKPTVSSKSAIPQIETRYVKKDLLKSFLLTLGALAIITSVYFLIR